MPGKNKQQKNAFYFYMQELMQDLKREGRVFPGGLADVVPIAHPRFKALDDKEKERFENMAKEFKKRMRGQPGDAIRQDNVGNIIAHRRDDVMEYEKDREKEIKSFVRKWPQDLSWVAEKKFYFIDVQALCKTPDDDYLPVEIALVEFSMKEGMIKCYHQFLKPGSIPSGMRYECMSKSEETHQIPVEGHPDATSNYLSVQNSIENFLNPGGALSQYPPVFALREEWRKVESVIGLIRQNSCLGPRAAHIPVYELESLFIALLDHAGQAAPSKQYAVEILTSTTHDFQPGIKCNFHEELECQHCSLLWVRKFCFAISDAMVDYYNFEIKPRRHLPSRKVQQFQASVDSEANWVMSKPKSNQETSSSKAYSSPALVPLPTTASVLTSARIAQPAPIFRPPGAPNINYGVNKTPITRYQQQTAWRAAVPEESALPSQNTDLANCREATWVPNSQSRASWSRRTTPASTPRATPMATPLATPHHSPPREGAYFPQSFTRRDHVKPPPGFSSRPQQLHDNTQATPKAFNAQMNPQSIPQNFNSEVSYGSQMEFGFQPVTPSPWGGGDQREALDLDTNFPSLSIHPSPGKGRGRGRFARM